MEADSINACILGEDAKPGTPEFNLFIKEVRNEMTVKCGQKCTAIRRIIVPGNNHRRPIQASMRHLWSAVLSSE